MNKSSFENELINKIQFKASSKVSADMVLFKAFKFFDLYNNGFLVKKDFFKAIAKCGVIVDTYDLDEIYRHYDLDENGKVNYKVFIDQILFPQVSSSVSEKVSQMSSSRNAKEKRDFEQTDQKANSPHLAESNINQIYRSCSTHEEVVELVKKQFRKTGISGILRFAINVKRTDELRTHFVSLEKIAICLSWLKNSQIELLTQKFCSNQNNEINYAELIYTLKGGMPQNRQVVADKLFNHFDHRKEGQIEINTIINGFKDPKQLGNFKQAVSLYCQFQRIEDGIFTDEDFNDFFEFLSFAFLIDQEFFDFIDQGFYDSCSSKSISSRYSRQRQFHPKQPYEQKSRKIQNSPIYGDFRKVKQEESEPVNSCNNSPCQKQISEKRSLSSSKRSEICSVTTPQVKQIQMILFRIKKRLASKGTKGFLLFEKNLQAVDSKKDGYVNLEQFKAVIKDHKIDITVTETLTIFDIFCQQNQKKIEYHEFLQTLKGQTPEERRDLCRKIWSQVKLDNSFTTLHKIKLSVNFRNHPHIQTGRKDEEQIWQQIKETIFLIQELNRMKRSEEVSRQVFQEYAENLSLSISENQLFESLAFNFWKVDSGIRIEDQYAGSRKMFDPTRKGYLQDHHRYVFNGGSVTDNAPFGTFQGSTTYTTENQRI